MRSPSDEKGDDESLERVPFCQIKGVPLLAMSRKHEEKSDDREDPTESR